MEQYLSEPFSSFLFQFFAYGGGSAAIAFATFRFLGSSWIDNRFAQKLEFFRHEHAKELEKLKIEIDSVLNGKLKLQELEFELLPKAWALLDEAYGSVSVLVSSTRYVPRIEEMSESRLDEFIEGLEWSESYREELRQSENKVQDFLRINFLYDIGIVKSRCREFHNFVIREGIFFPKTLKENLTKIAESMWSATGSIQLGHQYDRLEWEEQEREKVENESGTYKEIESEIHQRLQIHGVSNGS